MPVDIHVHPWTKRFMLKNGPIMDACDFFGLTEKDLPASLDVLIDEMDRAGVDRAVILGQDSRSTRNPAFKNYTITNRELAKMADRFDGRLIPFAGVDPNSGVQGLKELKDALSNMGFAGLKIHGSASGVYPNDMRVGLLCELCQEMEVPVLFHTGTTGLGSCDIKYSKPEYFDDVARDFPDLKIILAHFGWPWHEVAIAVALRHRNVFLDVSGWKPRYLPDILVRYMNGPLKEKVLFGTDFPMIKQSEWMDDFKAHLQSRLKSDVTSKLLDSNARKLLKL